MAEKNIEATGQSSGSQQGLGHMLDGFNPADIKVLAIDSNVVCLEILVAHLKKCQYQVTSTTMASEALKILRENKQTYHLVITDVQRPDMDGFKLLQIIALEMDIPVIMVSADEDKGSILKAIKHGARDYLIKPVRLQEIRNIWQHVVRKRKLECCDRSTVTRDVADPTTAPPPEFVAKLEEHDDEDIEPRQGNDDLRQSRRRRIQWTEELNSKFFDAIQKLHAQNEKIHPKRIREIMNVKGLTRENIASHLQKYRNTLKKRVEETSEQTDKPRNILHDSHLDINPTPTASTGVNQVSYDQQKWVSAHEPSRYGQYQSTVPLRSLNNVGPNPGITWPKTINRGWTISSSFPSQIPLTKSAFIGSLVPSSGFSPHMGPFPSHNHVTHYDVPGSGIYRPISPYSGQELSAWSMPGVFQDDHTKPLADEDIMEMLNELYSDDPLRL